MTFILLVEFVVLAVLVWALLAQVVLPLASGRPMFPMFGRMPKLQDELSRVRQAGDELAVEKEIAAEKEKLTPKEK